MESNKPADCTSVLLYLHIPFCHRVCPYCSFYKHTPGATAIGRFIEALAVEARQRIGLLEEPVRTLYLGGGTPSMLSPRHLGRLFGALHEVLDFGRLEEVTLEANPATFDVAKARLFAELGVTRVSLGIQSLAPHVLETLGREHSPAQAAHAVGVLREAGIAQVNIDLMFSVPGQSAADWEDTLRQTLLLEPDHVSAYNLNYEEDTAFFDSLRRGEFKVEEDQDATLFEMAVAMLSAGGLAPYETSNYARPGRQSVHNLGYWRGEDYLGLGPSAVSTLAGVRWQNVADTARYVAQVEGTGQALGQAESLTAEALRIERIAMGLRTAEGIPLSLLDSAGRQHAATLTSEGLAEMVGERLVLIHHGRALVDAIAAAVI